MSRCFPYPPPGYSRNGATYEALIESIKLQKENVKAKAERKKEKRAKKEKIDKKEKRKTEEKLKPQPQSQIDSHKQLQTSANFKEQSLQNIKRKEPTIEHLENSDLTEEHGQPVDSHKPSYSSDSTQNSNKRKREDPVVPDDDSNHAKPIFKIRLLKKQKGPDSVQETSRRNEQQKLSTSENIVPFGQPTSNSLNGHVQGDRSNRSRKQSTSISGRQILPSNQIVPPVPPQLKKSDVALLTSSKHQPISSHRRPLGHELPTPSQIAPPVPSVSGRMSIDEIKAPVNIEKKVGPTRSEKKLMKKHSKYEKLIGSWVPPVLEASTDGGDDDWLLGSWETRSARSALSSGDVEMCRESLWQPCARFLVEADVYAMPYTVPF